MWVVYILMYVYIYIYVIDTLILKENATSGVVQTMRFYIQVEILLLLGFCPVSYNLLIA